jgi:hypothetical protein
MKHKSHIALHPAEALSYIEEQIGLNSGYLNLNNFNENLTDYLEFCINENIELPKSFCVKVDISDNEESSIILNDLINKFDSYHKDDKYKLFIID